MLALKKWNQEEVIEHFADRAGEYIDLSKDSAKGPIKVEHLSWKNPARMANAGWWLKYNFPELGSVLEIGCGAGRLARWFHDALGLDYVGIDTSDKAIRWATSAYKKSEAAVDFEVCSIQEYTALDGEARFDLAFTYGVLMHIPPEEIERVADCMRLHSDIRMVVEMVRCNKKNNGPHIFIHDYEQLFGMPIYSEMLDKFKRIMIFENKENV